VVLGAVTVMLPYGVARTIHLRRVDAIERRLPEFLEDVAESGSFGLTLAEAIEAAARGQYGGLTAEIRRMAAQIAWGIPVADALQAFAERIPTPLVRQAVTIVIRAQTAGGNYPDVLRRVAHDARATQLARTRRRSAMTTYVTVVYLSFFVFLLTIYVLAAVFLPQMLLASGTSATFSFGGLVGISVVTSLFLALTVAVLVHGVGDGLVSGLLYRGRWVDGLPHAAVLLAVGWIVMRFVVPPIGGSG
jgi:flagellar protein FlaJ